MRLFFAPFHLTLDRVIPILSDPYLSSAIDSISTKLVNCLTGHYLYKPIPVRKIDTIVSPGTVECLIQEVPHFLSMHNIMLLILGLNLHGGKLNMVTLIQRMLAIDSRLYKQVHVIMTLYLVIPDLNPLPTEHGLY